MNKQQQTIRWRKYGRHYYWTDATESNIVPGAWVPIIRPTTGWNDDTERDLARDHWECEYALVGDDGMFADYDSHSVETLLRDAKKWAPAEHGEGR